MDGTINIDKKELDRMVRNGGVAVNEYSFVGKIILFHTLSIPGKETQVLEGCTPAFSFLPTRDIRRFVFEVVNNRN